MNPKGFGRIKKRQAKLESRKDWLSEINRIIPWDMFRSILERLPKAERKSNAGRNPINVLLLFKLLALQQLYNFSDEELEYQTPDRGSFRRFLGLNPSAEVPDATTVWLFRQRLNEAGLIEELFEAFNGFLEASGYEAKRGQIIDATLVPVPIQHNSREENKQIKAGEIPPE